MGVVLSCLALAPGLFGCATEEQSYAGNDAYCDGLCGAAQRCGRNSNRDACFDDCVDRMRLEPSLSEGGGVSFGACVTNLSCQLLDQESAFEDCWDSSKDRVPVSESTREFCEGYTEQLFECAYGYSMTECERNFRMWGDDVLQSVTDCSRLDECAERDACTERVFQ